VEANVGDKVIVRSRHVGIPERVGEIIEVRGSSGAPPYVVRWEDAHEALFVPGPDTVIEHSRRAS
jgi:hypothetical protein